MKGAVFTEFIEFVEESYGFDTADVMLEPDENSDKIYTQAGNYPFEELVALVLSVHETEKVELEEILFKFGRYLFGKLIRMAPFLISDSNSTIEVISKVDTYIHIEVKKLYPEAELPKFHVLKIEGVEYLEIEYVSEKRLEILAKGLMMGASDYFKESIDVFYEVVNEEPYTVIFKVRKIG
jgi:hypothetical protein